jgi:hypothetical protein
MEWLEQTHPDLRRQYWQQIRLPGKDEKVTIIRHRIEEAVFLKLSQVVNAYYASRPLVNAATRDSK